jgi:hypothetical protein
VGVVCADALDAAHSEGTAGRDAQMQMDSEPKYFIGANASLCGQQDIQFRLIKRAIEQGYCAYEAVQSEVLLVKLRQDTSI